MKPGSHPPVTSAKSLIAFPSSYDTRSVFNAFTRLAACALAAQTREAEYTEEAKRWEKQDLELLAEALGALIGEMEVRPFEDIIGGHYMEFALSHKGQQWNGEFRYSQICLRPHGANDAWRHGNTAG